MSSERTVPLYRQVKNYIVERIESGDWPEDFRVPSENELVDRLGASRMTVNRALRELTSEGLITRQQGVGTFVAGSKPQSELLEIRNIADEIRERRHSYSCDVLVVREERLDKGLAGVMRLVPGGRVFRSTVVHRENGVPVQIEDRLVNPALAADYLTIDFTATTPHEYLMRAAPLAEFEHVVEAVLPDARTQRLLEIGTREPCLLLHRRTWSLGQVASRAWLTHPGSRYRLGARAAYGADGIAPPPTA